jgi:hypothetical protein
MAWILSAHCKERVIPSTRRRDEREASERGLAKGEDEDERAHTEGE